MCLESFLFQAFAVVIGCTAHLSRSDLYHMWLFRSVTLSKVGLQSCIQTSSPSKLISRNFTRDVTPQLRANDSKISSPK